MEQIELIFEFLFVAILFGYNYYWSLCFSDIQNEMRRFECCQIAD